MNDNERWGISSGWSSEQSSVLDNMYYGLEQRKRASMAPVGAAVPVQEFADGSVMSRSEAYLRNRSTTGINAEAASRLSPTRQEYLKEVNERSPVMSARPNLGLAAQITPRVKTASVAASSQGRITNSSNTTHMGPDIYSPFFLTQNIMLPRDRQTMNAWNRAFYDTNPYVRNAINLHATYPISKLNIKCEDKKVEKFFLDMADRLDLQTAVQNAALELWMMGETFNYANFDESTGSWDRIFQHNPDYIRVHASPLQTGQPVISMKPDPELVKIITSNEPEYVRIREQIDPRIIEHVQRNEAIPLDNFNVSHLKMLNRPYDVRGTSIITSVWRQLMLLDKIYEAKLVQFDAMINPLTLIKIGENGVDGHYPRQDEIDAFRAVFETAQFDKDFKIITHQGVTVDRVGFSGQTLDVSTDIDKLLDAVLIGLMIPKSVLTQEGATYASASVALDVMRQRYNSFRTMMSNWLEKKIFAPISEVQGFYNLTAGKKQLIVPQIEWNKMSLHDLSDYINHVGQGVEKNRISQRTLDLSLGLNRHNEIVNMRQEMIETAIQQREKEALTQMTLAELRALDPEEEIVAPEKDPLPGQTPLAGPGGAATPGAPLDLGMPPAGGGLGGGGLDLGPLPGGGPEAPPPSAPPIGPGAPPPPPGP